MEYLVDLYDTEADVAEMLHAVRPSTLPQLTYPSLEFRYGKRPVRIKTKTQPAL